MVVVVGVIQVVCKKEELKGKKKEASKTSSRGIPSRGLSD